MIRRFLVCIEAKCIQYGSDFLYKYECQAPVCIERYSVWVRML